MDFISEGIEVLQTRAHCLHVPSEPLVNAYHINISYPQNSDQFACRDIPHSKGRECKGVDSRSNSQG